MKNILGLDLGTNSVGWALIAQDFNAKKGTILGMGSRIIPMSQDILGKFGEGNSISQTAERTGYRSTRRLRERHLLRRERLHRVLHILGFLPEHYANKIDFNKKLGQFIAYAEPKIAYNDDGFLFKASFSEMLNDFQQSQPELLKDKDGNDCLIPHDWTLYYLRKKALTEAINKEELSWIILNFNQKRGYYQLRGEEVEENPNKKIEFHALKIVEVQVDEEKNAKGDIWYTLLLENGWKYRRSSKTAIFDWKDKIRDFIVTTDLNPDGSEKLDKEGQIKRSFRAPSPEDWTLLKTKTQQEIDRTHKTVGTYIYDELLRDPAQKIKGKLVRTIERTYYKEELTKILQAQAAYHKELNDAALLSKCIKALYSNNYAHQQQLETKDFNHLFLNDIIFYQRPLRSQKSSISHCSLESRIYKDKDGVAIVQPLKVIPKSNPYFQEFRLWQWMQNLSINRQYDDSNVTSEFLASVEDRESLFTFLNNRKEIDQKSLLKYLLEKQGFKSKALAIEIEKYRWNFVQDKSYPCNETKALLNARLQKVENLPTDFFTPEIEFALWHIIYSVTDKVEYEKALRTFAKKYLLNEISFFDSFKKIPPFPSDYGSYSQKAILKLLPLMRMAAYWKWEDVNDDNKVRITKIITGEYDETIKDRVREKAIHLQKESDFQGLPLWLTQYIIYGRHSEAALVGKWNSVKDLEEFLENFKQHTLRNPIVEQIIVETLRVVREIWITYGKGAKDFFDEIHIELGRDMKNTANDRQRMSATIATNENTNLRLKLLLAELANDQSVANVRAYSPVQLEILKIYEEGVLNGEIDIAEDIIKISKTAQPSSADLKRYKLWLEQKYKSPYTGQIIPLNKLFTSAYEIEHIIPQSRYFDDSLSNKIICEAAVNKLKDNLIGIAFIKQFHGQIVEVGMGKQVKIFDLASYENFVNQHYQKNKTKRSKLLAEEIPEKMIERQLNDTRYISKYISNILSNIVRAEINDDGVNSKNLLPGNGKITNSLKQDWGLNDVWNELILPRFERMNMLTKSTDYTSWNENHKKFLPTVPIAHSKSFSKKRIDHRHHALDALVIACATKEHVNFMNNEHALKKEKTTEEKQSFRYDLRAKLCSKKFNDETSKNYSWTFIKPWANFTVETKTQLSQVIVSFKQNLRVINKATNYYQSYKDDQGAIRIGKDGVPQKGILSQQGTNWAIRKPLHKETVSGKVTLAGVKVAKNKILTATRKAIDASFTAKDIAKITDTGIQKILFSYLNAKNNDSAIAFSAEGLEDLNKNIRQYNDGKDHKPIQKVRIFEEGLKFKVGEVGNKTRKYVETASGTNLFFAVYQDPEGKRTFETIPLNLVIERQKQGLGAVPESNEKGHSLLFTLSPNDLVYIPDENEESAIPIVMDINRIYKVVSFSGMQLFFVRHDIATSILLKFEFSTLNKSERSIEGIMIKNTCLKLRINRLGNNKN